MTSSEALFFAAQPALLPIYAALADAIATHCSNVTCKVQKTQITFCCPRVFLCVSVRKVAGVLRLVVTFGLAHRVASSRVWQASEPYPNRWTHHVLASVPQDIDAELLAWIDEADAFARAK